MPAKKPIGANKAIQSARKPAAARKRPTKTPARTSGRAVVRNRGSGGLAQGDGAIGLGKKAIYAGGDLTVIKGSDPASRALRAYLAELRASCSVLPIAAMGGQDEGQRDVTLDQVYIALDTTSPRPKGKGRAKAEDVMASERDQKRLPVLDAVVANPQVVLLGGPGSGKSSFVNQLIADVAAARIKQPHNLKDAPAELLLRVPIRTVLRELAERFAEAKLTVDSDARALLDAVWAHWSADLARSRASDAEAKLRLLLQEGKGLLVFDGLDEVAQESRLTIRKAVGAVLAQYGKSRVIITCRSRSYPDIRFEAFPDFTLANLSEPQIKAFVAGWYRAHVALKRITEDEANERINDLTRAALGNYRALAEESPLLLTIMAIVHRKGVSLPNEEVRLYQQAVEVLLSRWQQEKRLRLHTDVQKLLADNAKLDEVMQAIAYEQHALQGSSKDPQALLPRKDLIDLLERPELLGAEFNINAFLNFVDTVSGLLIGHGGSQDARDKRPMAYGFPHRTFQEYLAGRRIMWGVTRTRKRVVLERAAEGDYWANAARYGWESLAYLGNTRNDDLVDLALALCPHDAPQSPAQWRATGWAGRMAALAGAERVQAFADEDGDAGFLSERLVPRLLSIMTEGTLPAIERAEAGDALAVLGDPRFSAERWFLPAGDDWGFIEIPTGAFAMGTAEAEFEHVMEKVDVMDLIRSDKGVAEIFGWESYPGNNTVQLDAFCIARYPVTVAQFRAFIQATKYNAASDLAMSDPDTRPVRYVSWHDAIAYCGWLTDRLRESPIAARMNVIFPHGWKVTLPSEAEWERAARGPLEGNPNPRRMFSWADDRMDPELANIADTKIAQPSTVGCFPLGASPDGCVDMIGNVWEWTRSALEPYPYQTGGERDDETTRAEYRVRRGGAFFNDQHYARCAFRNWNHPDFRSHYYGFRVCVSPTSH